MVSGLLSSMDGEGVDISTLDLIRFMLSCYHADQLSTQITVA